MHEQVPSFLINLQNLLNNLRLKLIRHPHFLVICYVYIGYNITKAKCYIVIVGLSGGGDLKYLHAYNNEV